MITKKILDLENAQTNLSKGENKDDEISIMGS